MPSAMISPSSAMRSPSRVENQIVRRRAHVPGMAVDHVPSDAARSRGPPCKLCHGPRKRLDIIVIDNRPVASVLHQPRIGYRAFTHHRQLGAKIVIDLTALVVLYGALRQDEADARVALPIPDRARLQAADVQHGRSVEPIGVAVARGDDTDAVPLQTTSNAIQAFLPELVHLGLLRTRVDVAREERDRPVDAETPIGIWSSRRNLGVDARRNPQQTWLRSVLPLPKSRALVGEDGYEATVARDRFLDLGKALAHRTVEVHARGLGSADDRTELAHDERVVDSACGNEK